MAASAGTWSSRERRFIPRREKILSASLQQPGDQATTGSFAYESGTGAIDRSRRETNSAERHAIQQLERSGNGKRGKRVCIRRTAERRGGGEAAMWGTMRGGGDCGQLAALGEAAEVSRSRGEPD